MDNAAVSGYLGSMVENGGERARTNGYPRPGAAARALVWALRPPAFLAATALFLSSVTLLALVTLVQRVWVAVVPEPSRLPSWLRPWWVAGGRLAASADGRERRARAERRRDAP